MGDVGQAYGAGMAGSAFDAASFVKQPSTILRLVAIMFGVILMGTVGGSYADGQCIFNHVTATCGFATFVGFVMLAAAVIFLVAEAQFNKISSVQMRRHVVQTDAVTSAVLTFLSFVIFVDLATKWGQTDLGKLKSPDASKSGPRAAIAFAFFCIPLWAGITFFAWRRYQDGAASAFAPSGFDQDIAGPPGAAQPYGYPGAPAVGGTESYQEPPFTAANDAAAPQYKEPHY